MWSFCRYCWARFEYGAKVDDPRASMTELLMAAPVGRWFMYLSFGLSTFHARSTFASSFLYARKTTRVAVIGGIGKWGLTGTGWRTGLLEVSRTGVLESTSTSVSRAAR